MADQSKNASSTAEADKGYWQANVRIIDAACQRLGIPTERAASVLETTGNTSSASIPLALVDAVESGRLHPGDLILFSGFGAGMTWASAVAEWRV